jgi:colanic acid biosynthesis glycosyl transferase WcaI
VATPKRAVAVVRAEMGWLPGEKILLHSGNMGLKQGLENLIEVARRAPAPWRVVLMGDGSQNSSLQKLAQNVPVTFLPPSPSEKFTEILAAADVLVVNERATAADMSLPSKLTSYFSVGRPVLAAVPLHGGTAAEVRQAGAGLVVPPEDPESFVRALDVLVADASLRERLGTAGKNYATSQLCSEIALDSLAALLKTIRVQSPSS